MSYAAATATAQRLLQRKGRRITLTRPGQGTIDEVAGTRTPGGDLTATFNVVGLPPGKSAEYQIGTLLGRVIEQFYMARVTGSLDPLPGDVIPWKGTTLKLIWVATYDPDASGAILHMAYGEAS